MGPAWATAAQPVSEWQPNFGNTTLNVSHSYGDAGAAVGVWVAYYRDQNYERKLITSSNTLTELTPGAAWAEVAHGSTVIANPANPAGTVALRTATLRGSSAPGASDAPRLRVWQVYWVGGRYFTSDARAKLQLALNRLTGQGDDAAAVFVYTAIDSNDATADANLARFLSQNFDSLTARLVAARGRP